MRTKLIIFVVVLAGILILANWLSGQYLASRLDRQLQQIAETDAQFSYEYSTLRVNPAMGSLTIRDLLVHEGNSRYQVGKIRGSMPYADIWRVIRHGSNNPAEQIHSFRLSVTSLTIAGQEADRQPDSNGVHSDSGNTSIAASPATVRTLNIVYNGRLDELLALFTNDRTPQQNHSFNLSIRNISSGKALSQMLHEAPVLADYHIPQEISQFGIQARYLAYEKKITISTMRMTAPGFTFRGGGEIHYGDQGWPENPESVLLNYDFNASTRDMARIQLSDILGGLSMDTLSVTSQIETDDPSLFGRRHPLAIPGETTLYLGNLHWYPSDRITEQYGMLFGMFGISERQLPIRSFRTTYHNSGDTLRINDALLATDPFDARLEAVVATPMGRRADIVDGSVTFVRTSAAFNDFVDGLEGLFQFDLPRRDGRLHFRFTGDPQAPDFDLNLPEP